MRWFSHSGDIGDVIYSLPTIRACGGGGLILFDYPGRTAHGMTERKADALRELLETQHYIDSVSFSDGFGPDHSLNGFRDHGQHGNLCDMHLATQGCSWNERRKAWIQVDPLKCEWPVLCHRSERYQNPNFPWDDALNEYRGNIAFCGLPAEHEKFQEEFGELPIVDCGSLLSLAQHIAGCDLFIGNQSSPLSIAHAMKHRVIMEICPRSQHHCVFQRMDCIIGWDRKIEWPAV